MIQLGDNKLFGLLDSGTSLSVLGRGSEIYIDHPNHRFRPMKSTVKTVSG